jgi:ATP-binding cassette subfamily B protein
MMMGGPRGRMMAAQPPGEKRPIRITTVRRVAGFFGPYRWQVALTVIAIALVAVIGLVNPLLLKLIIDDAIPNRDLRELYLYVGLMVILPIITGPDRHRPDLAEHADRPARDARSAQRALRAPAENAAALLHRHAHWRDPGALSSDVSGVQQVVTDTATSIVSNLATAISTVVAMAIISWQMTLISLGMLPFFLLLTYRVGNIRREVQGETQETVADLTAQTEETLSVSGMLLSKAFGRQQYEVARFQDVNSRLTALQIRQQMVGRWFFMIIGTFFSITPAIVYLYAGVQIIGGSRDLTIGDIVAFTTLQSRLFFPLGQMLNVQVEIQGAFALFDRIFEYLDLPVEIADRPGVVTLQPANVAGRVRFEHVSFGYEQPINREAEAGEGSELPADIAPFHLDDIDFVVEPGQLAALVGPSGSGKTTIAMLVPRFYDVDAGTVSIDGQDVRDVALASLGEVIGIVTQETYLFHATIRENIAYGKPDATDAEIRAAAQAAAIDARIMELPAAYETVVGERGYKLSGGEKQRIAIARVILKDPRILILDEAPVRWIPTPSA